MSGTLRTGRGRGRAPADFAVVRVLEKRLGALPVVAQFGRRLRMAEVIDELCPVRPVAPISHGEVIEALVANRLTAPAPLVQVETWAEAIAADEVYGSSRTCFTTTGSAVPWTRSPRIWMRSPARLARRRSASSGWTWPGCTGI